MTGVPVDSVPLLLDEVRERPATNRHRPDRDASQTRRAMPRDPDSQNVLNEHWHVKCEYLDMATKSKDICEHPGCTCPKAKDSNYCGAFCEGQASHPSIECEFGHTGCVATKRA